MINKTDLNKIDEYLWEIPASFRKDMKVSARIFTSETMLDEILKDNSLEQLVNVATLPGIKKYAIAMPDAHEGYGFPVGGVAAFSTPDGIISPGGIGYDINCGVRLLKADIKYDEIKPHIKKLSEAIFKTVPSGVGRGGKLKLKGKDLDLILSGGAKRAVEMGYGENKDLDNIESGGRLDSADPNLVSKTAKERGKDQLGTIGAGNHFIEIEKVDKVFDPYQAEQLGLSEGQVMILIHTGSRGLGHQIATDYIKLMISSQRQFNFNLPDRELACAPLQSEPGRNYFMAMAAGANFAWANRQLITHLVRNAWKKVLGDSRLEIVYDVAHNIAKIEKFTIDGHEFDLLVHRKGATRAYPDQPVIIPGSMGTCSYLLLGQPKSLKVSFGSSCHGAGRRLSRTQAKKKFKGADLKKQLEKQGIIINASSLPDLAEEAPEAYKDVNQVVEVIHNYGLAKKVVRLKPLGVIKG